MSFRGPYAKWLYLGAWVLLGLFMATQDILRNTTPLTVKLIFELLMLNQAQILVWAVLSLSTLHVVRRYPLYGAAPLRHWWIHLAAGILTTTAGLTVSGSLAFLLAPPKPPLFMAFQHYVFSFFPFEFLVCYWGVVGIHEGIQILKTTQERELKVSMLEAKVAQAKFRSVQMQLNSRFLFPTLNAVSVLIHSEPATADRMLIKLSQLLRLSLEQSREEETSLGKELALLDGFLEIERMRFGDRLRVEFEVPEAMLDAKVPSFVLQPLLDNAIHHGIFDRAQGGAIHIRARQEEGMLTLEVQDDGQQQAPVRLTQAQELKLVSTHDLRSRLEEIYGTYQDFDLQFLEGGGTLARIRLPINLNDQPPRFAGTVIPA